MIFDLENQPWKYIQFSTISHHKIQWFLLSMLISDQKSCFLGPIKLDNPVDITIHTRFYFHFSQKVDELLCKIGNGILSGVWKLVKGSFLLNNKNYAFRFVMRFCAQCSWMMKLFRSYHITNILNISWTDSKDLLLVRNVQGTLLFKFKFKSI